MVVGSARDPQVNLFLPKDRHDLSIYKQMLAAGVIRPYAMPGQVERLAEHLLEMLDAARIAGRPRDALKCIEILRQLNRDNREMATELDRIERLDAGKPTQISGQVAPETVERIKRIVSTQRARALNTEANDVAGSRGADQEAPDRGAGSHRPQGSGEVAHGAGDDARDHPATKDAPRIAAPDQQDGGRD